MGGRENLGDRSRGRGVLGYSAERRDSRLQRKETVIENWLMARGACGDRQFSAGQGSQGSWVTDNVGLELHRT